ncbi:bile acid:sodium symporter family protein [Streptomyces sp. TRM43335]|uniref:Bile acid:sodium symporter family protein n=1 Tax=Streptomyces taklimakanensis TaxID=2569853 RepID=A0A6G2B6S8_9ACTN|nr:bile acid:sodium symporter family protein [Streptomyces taklimakanensis]MTE17967.1 bile acid:sodium symporter family protein [Streptomyces taklimakanensis]
MRSGHHRHDQGTPSEPTGASDAVSPSPPASGAGPAPGRERGARRAVTLFPLLVLLAGAVGLLRPSSVEGWAPSVPYLLGVVMFGMGLTTTPPDFRGVLRRPRAVTTGLAAQYVVMPLLGWLIAEALGLPPELAAGVILVGCAPGGTASNVVTYLARGDVALSVSLTSVSTVLSPLLTPALTLLLAGEFLPVDTGSMTGSILRTVLLPVLAGLVVRLVAGRLVERALPVLPWVSVAAVGVIVAIVVAGSAGAVRSAAATVFVAVVLHNGLGLALGYAVGRFGGLGESAGRALTFEVGMQNSGLAASLAAAHFSPAAALPAAVFSVWHNVSGALAAAWFSRRGAGGRHRGDTGGGPAPDGGPAAR